jgi:hypothetical protein
MHTLWAYIACLCSMPTAHSQFWHQWRPFLAPFSPITGTSSWNRVSTSCSCGSIASSRSEFNPPAIPQVAARVSKSRLDECRAIQGVAKRESRNRYFCSKDKARGRCRFSRSFVLRSLPCSSMYSGLKNEPISGLQPRLRDECRTSALLDVASAFASTAGIPQQAREEEKTETAGAWRVAPQMGNR